MFRNRQSILQGRIRNFMATRYDNMVMKLQFAEEMNQNFESVETIVDFICEKMADTDDNAILIPYSVKEAMKNGLKVRNGKLIFYIIVIEIFLAEELKNLLADNGLRKILLVVRSQLHQSKEIFLKTLEKRFDSFFSPDEVDNRIIIKLWKELEEMKCDYLCPWCGMPCCGTQNCNDLYVKGELPSPVNAKVKHSCQFHRDSAIKGSVELVNGERTDRLFNGGGCTRRKTKFRMTDPENKDGPKISVPKTYYDTTWRIRSRDEDSDQSSGFFWQWFLAFVSNQ